MTKILINGINGFMGKELAKLILKNPKIDLLGGLDISVSSCNLPYKIFNNINDVLEKPDVIIDFSIPDACIAILPYCIENSIPIVIATTGFSDTQLKIINNASNKVPIFQSYNMSFQISLMRNIVCQISKILPNSNIEIIEKHHKRKKDAPSGTSIMLANAINSSNNNKYTYNLNRNEKFEQRNNNEIGFSSIRGGNIVGEHSVLFIDDFESLEIKHTAYSRLVFAQGAIKAAEFIIKKPVGLYHLIS